VFIFKLADAGMNTYFLWQLSPLPQEPPEYPHILIFLETRIIGLHFAADSMGLVWFKFFWRAS